MRLFLTEFILKLYSDPIKYEINVDKILVTKKGTSCKSLGLNRFPISRHTQVYYICLMKNIDINGLKIKMNVNLDKINLYLLRLNDQIK